MPTLNYSCDYCFEAHFREKKDCIKHEKECCGNPETKTCPTCANYKCAPYGRKTFDCKGTGKRESWKVNCDKWESKDYPSSKSTLSPNQGPSQPDKKNRRTK